MRIARMKEVPGGKLIQLFEADRVRADTNRERSEKINKIERLMVEMIAVFAPLDSEKLEGDLGLHFIKGAIKGVLDEIRDFVPSGSPTATD
jgi:hypothetical protein